MLAMMQASRALAWRRTLFVLPIGALALAIAVLALAVAGPPRTALDGLLLALFTVIMGWQSFIAWQYGLGFLAWLLGRRALSRLELRAKAVEPVATGRSRTAVLLPIYHEDPEKVFASLRVMARSLARTGSVGDVDFYVLSDTRDAGTAAAEECAYEAFLRWRDASDLLPQVRCRRRLDNRGRKVGNIADFCERWGDAYDFMIVLDADSLMTGAAMRRLIRLMEESPGVGLIQTVSYATNRETLFARVQQFAVRLYAPLAIRGLDIWQGHDGSYWGHNAILRVKAFTTHCELPVLSGRPPFGGEILCHDTVEAALMRRAGWEVRLLPDLDGTWEEMPTNLVDLLGRERRWCQGNLQHLRVLTLPGLRSASRAHLALGIAGYVAAPLWAAFLAVGTLRAALAGPEEGLGLLAYGLGEPSPLAAALFGLVVGILGVPKLLSLAQVLADGEARRAFGGARSILASALLEQLFWILLWPVLTVFNAVSVITTAVGRVVHWDAQARDDRAVPWAEALHRHLPHVLCGVLLALATVAHPWLAVWMLPVAAALIVSPALTAVSSRVDLGRASRRWGLFLTVDDTAPAEELKELRTPQPSLPAAQPAPDGLVQTA